MLDCIFRFLRGETDVNENGTPDNEELLRAIEILARRVEQLRSERESQ